MRKTRKSQTRSRRPCRKSPGSSTWWPAVFATADASSMLVRDRPAASPRSTRRSVPRPFPPLPRRCSTSCAAAPKRSPARQTSMKTHPRWATATLPSAAPPARTSSSASPRPAALPTSSERSSTQELAARKRLRLSAIVTPRSPPWPTSPSRQKSAPRSSAAQPA